MPGAGKFLRREVPPVRDRTNDDLPRAEVVERGAPGNRPLTDAEAKDRARPAPPHVRDRRADEDEPTFVGPGARPEDSRLAALELAVAGLASMTFAKQSRGPDGKFQVNGEPLPAARFAKATNGDRPRMHTVVVNLHDGAGWQAHSQFDEAEHGKDGAHQKAREVVQGFNTKAGEVAHIHPDGSVASRRTV